ncbi:MAG: ribbon-helix-helix protein, CopG family [Betaproteobacteria bacterium]
MRLDPQTDSRLAREAEREGKSRSELVRDALRQYLDQRERQRFIDQLAQAAQRLSSDEALAMAEEALVLDNEAQRLAEPAAEYKVRRKLRRK